MSGSERRLSFQFEEDAKKILPEERKDCAHKYGAEAEDHTNSTEDVYGSLSTALGEDEYLRHRSQGRKSCRRVPYRAVRIDCAPHNRSARPIAMNWIPSMTDIMKIGPHEAGLSGF
jgi:hypothetical protein